MFGFGVRRLCRAAQLATAALVLLSAVASLTWPFGWDQGVFAQVGDVIARGGLPYRDGWDVKGPLVYYLLALSQVSFGVNQWGIRVFDLSLLAAGTWSLTRIVTSLTSPGTGRWTGLVFPLIYLSGGYWDTAQPDGWVALLLTIAGLVIVPARRYDRLRLGGAGALIGFCALMKWFYVAYLLLPMLATLAVRRSGSQGPTLRIVGTVAAFLLPIAASVVWFGAHGALHDVVEAQFAYPAAVNVQQFGIFSLNLGVRAHGVAKFLMKPHVLAALPAMIAGLLVLWHTARGCALVLSAWIAIGLGCVVLQNRFVDYQWLPLVPPLVVLCAVGLHMALGGSIGEAAVETSKQWSTDRTALLAMLTAVVLTGSVALAPAMAVARWATLASGIKSPEQYYDEYFPQVSAGMKAANYLREHTTAHDQIAVWGGNGGILFLSRRTSATRFGTYGPLVFGEGTEIRARYRQEYLHGLERARPMYFVVSTEDLSDTATPRNLQGFPELLTFVAQNYELEKRFGGGVSILRRRGITATEAPTTAGSR
jgi:hypothetical protein